MTTPFRYETQLDRSKEEIRVLKLLPKDQWPISSQPACRMSNVSLKQNPKFSALSYVWGDPSDQKEIVVNGSTKRVTSNLLEALFGIAKPEGIVIWIDAICINQEDNDEKGRQVGMMGEIYRKATEVVAWLGPSAGGSDALTDCLNALGARAETCGLPDQLTSCMERWHEMTTDSAPLVNPGEIIWKTSLDGIELPVSLLAIERLLHSISGFKPSKHLLPPANLHHFFRRAWWSRVWVLQEITVAKIVQFACGKKRITRTRFQAAFSAYYGLSSALQSRLRQQQSLTPYQSSISSLASHRVHVMSFMSRADQLQKFPLVALLRVTRVGPILHLGEDGTQHLDSTDPRDKIFALLGIAQDREVLEELGVYPDYTKSRNEVYTTTASALLRRGYISILSECCLGRGSKNLPSWVPDWSLPTPETLQDVEQDHLTLCPEFGASGAGTQHPDNISSGHRLLRNKRLNIKIYDKVLEAVNVSRELGPALSALPVSWLCEILRLSYSTGKQYADSNVRLRDVVRTSHAATGFGDDGCLERRDMFLDALCVLKSKFNTGVTREITAQMQTVLKSRELKRDLKRMDRNPERFRREVRRISARRSPFVTQKGHLGVGSLRLKKGDVVALIQGAQVPFLLRMCGKEDYVIVSEAYVDGIMDGEAAGEDGWGYINFV